MRFLWLTLADPDPPINGQFLYSSGAIHALAAAGAELTVVGLARSDGAHRSGRAEGIEWRFGEDHLQSRWAGLLSRLPQFPMRTKGATLSRHVHALIAERRWDVIVFDSFALTWALAAALRSGGDRQPRLVYFSHNHETSVADTLARMERRPLIRPIKRLDALKVARLERMLARKVDLVTSNTPEDCEKFSAMRPKAPVEFLPPGYGGRRVAARRIDAAVPRRAIIVGSFDWIAKRLNLESFLAAADRRFAAAGVELYVVGSAEESYLAELRKKVVATRITGRVDDVTRYMDEARLALVPDFLGGFKLKALDYVFNRLPIFAMKDSVPGLPLVPEDSVMIYPDHDRLADGVLRAIDDFALLNRVHERAYLACRDAFDWSNIVGRLIAALSRLDFSPTRSEAAIPHASTA